jgi:hypothetical protein
MNKQRVKWTLAALAIVLVLIQVIQPKKTNPPVISSRALTAHVDVPEPVQAIMKRACYDCHSNETVWPWYSHVAPVSWMVVDDVNTGRSHVNLQDWEAQENESEAKEHLGLMCKEVREKAMPLFSYRLMHRDSRLSPEEVNTVCTWSQKFASAEPDSDEKSHEHHHDHPHDHDDH